MKTFYMVIFLGLFTSGYAQIKVEQVTIKCDTVVAIDLKTYMDSYQEDEYVSTTKTMRKAFSPTFFGDTSKRMQTIVLSIYCDTFGHEVTKKYRDEQTQPKENEILFLFEIENEGKDISTQKIYFKIGSLVQQSIKNRSFNYKALFSFLKCSVFKNDYFPEDLVLEAYNSAKEY